ncbi:uncharacterized protein LOC115462079 [Microcaecilia unicolor]|uniref:Uncharacterized protein LOC115462079 n=1 Tax=Microcaecilia unicolor TaxID=1415580 RepID=A0A6P7WXL7_9AMPH|nr:uncharacterized protein LOC115462079 [Microcaecilia unicolor]
MKTAFGDLRAVSSTEMGKAAGTLCCHSIAAGGKQIMQQLPKHPTKPKPCSVHRLERFHGIGSIMGIYASAFYNSGGKIIVDMTDPSQPNWITAHADACKMTIPEVLRCWSRFLMLHPDEHGNLPRHCFLNMKNPFANKMLAQIPVTDDEQVTFQTYCNTVSWLSKASQETKLRGIYQILTSDTLTKEVLQTLLHDLYPAEGSPVIDALSNLLLAEIDRENQGSIGEDQFVAWVQNLPEDVTTSILQFTIIPLDMVLTAETQHSLLPRDPTPEDRRWLSDEQLLRVANEMLKKRRDWKLLANNLGFLEKNYLSFEKHHQETKDQILEMLRTWKKTTGQNNQIRSLQEALRQSDNTDICNEIFHLNF